MPGWSIRRRWSGAWAGGAGFRSIEICPSRQYAEQYDLLINLKLCSGGIPALRIIGPPRSNQQGTLPPCRSNGDACMVRTGAVRASPVPIGTKEKSQRMRRIRRDFWTLVQLRLRARNKSGLTDRWFSSAAERKLYKMYDTATLKVTKRCFRFLRSGAREYRIPSRLTCQRLTGSSHSTTGVAFKHVRMDALDGTHQQQPYTPVCSETLLDHYL